jgi:molecular chaperone DnaK
MSRTTVDFGIDLGTTNSAIALLSGTNQEVIKNNINNEITPSAVFIDKRGQVQVGERAKSQQEDERAADDVYLEFKRLMGTDHQYKFRTSGRAMKPEELSAEVLKSLRGDVQQRFGEDMQACVITVPAAFEQKQCAATRMAGELAGFSQCPLLQEPVAAALAYGFQMEVKKEYWLIYDFGGGTFDAALMRTEDGSITVVNHGGDNHLGGSDIDWAVVEQLVIPQLAEQYNLPGFSRGNQRWRTVLAAIKRHAEIAKIQLSRSAVSHIEVHFEDADKEAIDIDIELKRDALVRVAEPITCGPSTSANRY